MMDTPSTKVDLHFSCTNLKNLDVGSKSDPMCVVYMTELLPGSPANRFEVGRTEMLKNNLNPVFATAVRLTYTFEVQQNLEIFVYDVDNDKAVDLKGSDLIGVVRTTVADVVSASAMGGFRSELEDSTGVAGKRGQIQIMAEELRGNFGVIQFNMVGEKLDKKDLFGKSDPYVNIYRVIGGQRVLLYKTETVMKTLDPIWNAFSIPTEKLGGCANPAEQLIFECWDWDKSSSDDLIGEATVTIGQIMDPNAPISMVLQHPKKAGKHNYKGSGMIHLRQHQFVHIPTFLEFIQGGCELNLIAAIDFTGSNGNPTQPSSLHYVNPSTPNQYEMAIDAVCNILLPYDRDGNIPVYGFGGRLPTGEVSHCFALNGTPQTPEVPGVRGIMDAYHMAIHNVGLSGPTYFAPFLQQSMNIVRACGSAPGEKYFVLLIITDGVINDMPETIKAIVDAANNFPISVVIVGVGSANFSNMDTLDGDEGGLRDQNGNVASRDIVQFVPFSKYVSCPPKLAQETLAEIPSQLCSFMRAHGIVPRPPPPPMVVAPVDPAMAMPPQQIPPQQMPPQ